MSKYVLMHGTFVEVSDDELMHWKYVKRVKNKNGKWKYYYDWDELKKDTKTFVKDPLGKEAKAKYNQAQQRYIDASNTVNGRRMSDVHYDEAAKGRGVEWVSNNNKEARAKAVKAVTSDSARLVKAKKELSDAKKAYEKTIPARLDKTKENAKSTIKYVNDRIQDKLGVDERDEYRKTKGEYERAKENLNITKNNAAKGNSSVYDSIYDYDQDRMVPHTVEYWTKRTSDLGKKYADSKKEYMNTPLGKVAKITTAVEDYISDLFEHKKSRAPEPKLSPVGTENIIKENVIKENVIKEDVITEDFVDANGNPIKRRKKR